MAKPTIRNSALRQQVSLKAETSFRAGGDARYFVEPDDITSLLYWVQEARARAWPFFILGGGTNTLFGDGQFPGLVISTKNLKKHSADRSCCELTLEAGVNMGVAIHQAQALAWSGLEHFVGIPGNIGGAVYGNAGAYYGGIERLVQRVRVIDNDGQFCWLEHDQINWQYRSSGLGSLVVAQVVLKLEAEDVDTIKERGRKLSQHKKSTQPLSARSAGCIFRNPQNLSAGHLIERVGLKGYCIGGAMVSEKHANFVINTGKASASEVIELIRHVQLVVKENTGIDLERELVTPNPTTVAENK